MNESVNRAFMYGESVFTTMRMVEGHVRDWELHFDRLKNGVEFVYGPFTDKDWVIQLRNRMETYLGQESGTKVIRLTVYRDQARGLRGAMTASSDLKIYQSASLYEPNRSEGQAALKLRTCHALSRPHWWPSFLKCGSYLETILQQKLTLKAGDDDLLFLSSQDQVLESSVANIFVVRNDKVHTAPAGPQVLEGVMRKKILQVADSIFSEVDETAATLDQAYRADGVFGSNSVRGLFLIDRIDDHEIKSTENFLQKYELLRRKVLA